MKKKLQFLLVLLSILLLNINNSFAQTSGNAVNYNDFAPIRYDADLRGDILLIGNNIINRVDRLAGDPAGGPTPTTLTPYNGTAGNNGNNLQYINTDPDGGTNFSSSRATLTVPNANNCSRIRYAALYWSATYLDANRAPIDDVRFRTPGGAFQNITGQILFDNFGVVDPFPTRAYACYADVTSILQALPASASGEYTLANVTSSVGNNGAGFSAGWTLFVVYENPTSTAKSITSFDGAAGITGPNSRLDIPVTGFRTIPSGPVNAKVAFSALEGDIQIRGDQFLINNQRQSTTQRPAVNPSNLNFFNAKITNGNAHFLNRTPDSRNTFGHDAGVYDVLNPGNAAIANGATNALLTAFSTGDNYYYYFNAFAVEVIQPNIVLTKEVTNAAGQDITGTPPVVQLCQEINYVLGFQNIGNDGAQGVTFTDILPVNVDYLSSVVPAGMSQPTVIILPGGAQQLTYTIPPGFVPAGGAKYEIIIRVRVQCSCNELRDACSDVIQNIASASYTGVISNIAITGAQSIAELDSCGNATIGPTVFLGDRSGCNYTQNVVLCGSNPTTLTAPSGYTTYSWTLNGNPYTTVPSSSQSINVTTGGAYVATCIAPNPCVSIQATFNVAPFNPITSNPLVVPRVDDVVICPDDFTPLAKIYLCGLTDSQLIQTGLTTATLTWERLTGACPTPPLNCPNTNPACTWTTVGTGPDFLADTAGTYRVRITFQNGCDGTYYFDVFRNNFNATFTATDYTCNTPASIVINGVPSGYEFSLNSPTGPWQPSNVFSPTSLIPLPAGAGVYTVYIKQTGIVNNPCVFNVSNIPIQVRTLDVDVIPTVPLCAGTFGSIRVLATGVRPQYYYTLYNGAAVNPANLNQQSGATAVNDYTFSGLNSGTYTVLVTTDDGCTYNETLTIIVPTQLIATATQTKPITCTDGIFTVNVTGGTQPYVITIPSGNIAQGIPINVDTPGTIAVLVTDANNCVTNTTVTITAIPQPVVNVVPTNALCFGQSSGAINFNVVNANGYTLTYSTNFNPVTSTGTFSPATSYTGLPAGTYDVAVSYELNGEICYLPSQVTIGQPLQLGGQAVLVPQTTCTANATINIINVVGGTAPYEYSIGGAYQSSSTFLNVPPGTYFPKIRDFNGCVFDTNSVIVPNFNPPTDLSFSISNPITCTNPTTTVTVTAVGGNATLTYTILPALPSGVTVSGNVFSNLGPGTYNFQVTDGLTCTYSETYTILPVSPILVTGVPNNNVVCFGTNTGNATYNVSGFTGTYNYQVNANPVVTNQTNPVINLNNLAAGSYNLVVTDNLTGCTSNATVIITQPTAPLASTNLPSPITCLVNGSVVISPTGGRGVNTIVLTLPNATTITQTNNGTFNNLSLPGLYTYTVTDVNNCTINGSFSLTAPVLPTATISATSDLCFNSNGATIVVTASGGVPGYTYSLDGQPYVSTNTFPVTPGSHTVTVRDSFGCISAVVTQVIQQQLLATASLDKGLDCTVTPDAEIDVTISGGTTTYSYQVSYNSGAFGASTAVVGNTFTHFGALPGTYTFLITDSINCTTTTNTITVNLLIPLTLAPITVNSQVLCFGQNTGAISVVPSGGQPNYTITSVLNTTTGEQFAPNTTGLTAGNYTVIVTDANSCTISGNVTITPPIALDFDVNVVSISCGGGATTPGSISVENVVGGTGPYTYYLSNTVGSPTFAPFTTATGVNHTFPNINFGIYTVTVVDGNGCPISETNIIMSSPPNNLNISNTALAVGACGTGASINVVVDPSVAGGPYHFALYQSQPGNIFPLPPHNYFDIADLGNPTAQGYYDADLVPLVPGDLSHLFTGLATGTQFTFIVYDETTGCYYYETATTASPTNSTMVVVPTPTPVTCIGAANGTVSVAVSGHQGTQVSYQIFSAVDNSPASTSTTITVTAAPFTIPAFGALPPGSYYVLVTEVNGPVSACSETSINFNILQSTSLPIVVANVTKNDNCNLNAGIISAVGSFGTGPYTYVILPGGTLPAPTNATWDFTNDSTSGVFNVEGGTYDVYVRDFYGCIQSDLGIIVPTDPNPSVTVTLVPTTLCNTAEGTYAIDIVRSTGFGPYTYNISTTGPGGFTNYPDATGTFTVSNLNSGTYIVTIKDVNGCTSSDTIIILPPVVPSAGAVILPTADCDIDVADITVTATGGSGSYNYSINTTPPILNQASNVFTNVDASATPYIITVTDTNTLCTFTTSASVPLGVPVTITLGDVDITDVSCFGFNNGSAIVTLPASNTETPYTYVLTGTAPVVPAQTNNDGIFNNLTAGDYSLVITSGRGCSNLPLVITVGSPTQVANNTNLLSDFACNFTNQPTPAQIQIVGSGGTPPYFYSINGVNYFPTPNDIFSIVDTGVSQTITTYVRDSNGCLITDVITLNPLPTMNPPTVNETIQLNCNQPGEMTIVVTGGSGDYSYQLLPGGPSNINGIFPLTSAGTYNFLVTDNVTGCTIPASFTKPVYDTLQANTTFINGLNCFGDTNGSFSVAITGYTGNYNYQVFTSAGVPVAGNSGSSNTSVPLVISNLTFGNFYVAITETSYPFCTKNSNIQNIAAPNSAVTSIESQTAVTCTNNQGSITVTGSGGTNVFTYAFYNGATSIQAASSDNSIDGLAAGNYFVETIDSNGCSTGLKPVTLLPATPISYISVGAVPTVLDCINDQNSTLTVVGTSGGFGSGYLFALNYNNATGTGTTAQQLNNPVFPNLSAGTYSVTISDAWNCSITTTDVIITQPLTDITASIATVSTLDCVNNQILSLTVSGGTPPYTYSTSASGPFIAVPFPSNTVNPISVGAGTHSYYVQDANNCKIIQTNTITVNPYIDLVATLNLANTTVKCAGDNTASVSATATGGFGNYSYSLYRNGVLVQGPINANNALFQGLDVASYFIIVTGDGSCFSPQYPFDVMAPPALGANSTPRPSTCVGVADGAITINPFGGLPPYQYIVTSINGTVTYDNPVLENLLPGPYTIVVQDANNCYITITETVGAPSPVVFVTQPLDTYNEVCIGDNVSFSFTVGGGREFSPATPYTLEITQNGYTTLIQTLTSATGLFNVTLTSSTIPYEFYFYATNEDCGNGKTVTILPGIDLNPIVDQTITCTGTVPVQTFEIIANNSFNAPISDFTFELDNSGIFTNNYIYTTAATATTPFTTTNLSNGSHVVVVRYNNGCESDPIPFTVVNYSPLGLTLAQAGLNQFSATATGGLPNYSYTVNGNSYSFASPYLINASGNYEVIVTDANGCSVTRNIDMIYYPIEIPDFFTPTGDGNNDTWGPNYIDNFPDVTFEIYDRYGRRLRILTYLERWDGKYEGKEMPSGDYWYILKLNSPLDDREFVGHFTLYR